MEEVQASDIAAGGWHSLAISKEGDVYAWGRGEYGRLGLGDRSGSSKLRPQKVGGRRTVCNNSCAETTTAAYV
jgi:alpha-tubulin suppressor-like RCC1 family protein